MQTCGCRRVGARPPFLRLIFDIQIHIQIHMILFQVFAHSNPLLKKDSIKNLNLNAMTYKVTLKRNSYLTSLARPGSVNPSTLTFENMSLTETMTNLLTAWQFNQK